MEREPKTVVSRFFFFFLSDESRITCYTYRAHLNYTSLDPVEIYSQRATFFNGLATHTPEGAG